MPDQPQNVQSSYPLSALFVLLAACAVVSALLAPVARATVSGEITPGQLIAACFIGMAVVGIIGGVIGLYHYRPLRGLGWGWLTGGIIGMVVGPLMLAPADALGSLVTMSLGGSVVLLITGAAFGFGVKD